MTLFTTGMIAQSVDLREFHRHHVKSRPNEVRNWSLPQQIRLPSIDVALSGIFPSMVFDKEKDANKFAGGQGNLVGANGELASIVRPLTAAAAPAKQPWASDMVSIRFKGVEPPMKTSEPSDGDSADAPLTCLSDAVIKVRKPAKFVSLKGTVDRDVSYHPGKGEFSLRIRHAIGESTLATLKSRVKAVDRFVNFLESMDKAKGTITSESVTLRQVTFSYNEPPPTEGEDTEQLPHQWRIILDLSKDDINIQLEKGNPHLRVADLMRNLVNSEGGIQALMVWLPTSLPAYAAIERIETAWADIQTRRQGYVEFSIKTIDWMSIRYVLPGSEPVGQQSTRQLTLDIKIKGRRGELWWNIYRVQGNNKSEDEFSIALKPIWQGRGTDWHGLVTSAAGRPSNGIVHLLTAIDDAIRALVGTDGMLMVDPTTQGSSSQSMQSFTQPTTQASQGSAKAGPQVYVID